MDKCYIPVSIGEIFDKYTILLLKQKNIKDAVKLNNINKEIDYLKEHIDKYKADESFNELFDEIYNINKILWDIEDSIRFKEFKNEFDDEFINLARCVYINNDKRAFIKNKINNYFNSDINEIKEYINYN